MIVHMTVTCVLYSLALTFNIETLQTLCKNVQCSALENTQLDETRDSATSSEPREEIKLLLGCRHVNWQHIHCPVYFALNVQRFRRSHGRPLWLHITDPRLWNEEGPCVIFLRPCFSFCVAHHWDLAGPVQSFNLVLRGAISFQSKAHKAPTINKAGVN